MIETLYLYLLWLLLLPLSLSVLRTLYRWHALPTSLRWLAGYLLWNLALEIATFLLPSGTNNLPLLHLHTLVEFVIFTLMYRHLDIFHGWGPRRFWGALLGVVGLMMLNSLFIQALDTYNSYGKTLAQVLIIGYAVSFLLQLHDPHSPLRYFQLINIAIILYYSGSLFIFMFGNFMSTPNLPFWVVNALLNLLFQTLVLIGLWKASRLRKSPSSSPPAL